MQAVMMVPYYVSRGSSCDSPGRERLDGVAAVPLVRVCPPFWQTAAQRQEARGPIPRFRKVLSSDTTHNAAPQDVNCLAPAGMSVALVEQSAKRKLLSKPLVKAVVLIGSCNRVLRITNANGSGPSG